jgi:hypothetical protein
VAAPKTWRDPSSETLSTYVLGAGAGICGVLAVAVGCTLVTLVIVRARGRLAAVRVPE